MHTSLGAIFIGKVQFLENIANYVKLFKGEIICRSNYE